VALLLAALAAGWSGSARGQAARVSRVLERVRPDRISDDVAALAALGTRFALAPDFSRATHLVRQRLEGSGLAVSLDPLLAGVTPVANVVARRAGSVAERPPLWITAHYDSVSHEGAAPGAEDNASGVAALLEIARLLAGEPLATEVVLVALAAEEEGLWGSRHLAERVARGERATPQAAINLDMVGYDPRGLRRIVLDTVPLGRALAARVGSAAQRYTDIDASASLFSTGLSDHAAFLTVGVPALTVFSSATDDYPYYHSAADLPRHVDAQQVARVARATLASVLLLGGFADGAPVAHGGEFAVTTTGKPLQLSARESFDPQGQPLSYAWRRLDGPAATAFESGGRELAFTPREAGTYRFELVVSTPDGRRSEPDVAAAIVREAGGCAMGGTGEPLPLWLLASLLLAVRRRDRIQRGAGNGELGTGSWKTPIGPVEC
jgi:hypothetical protein